MAHFAEINENNIVTKVIVVHNNELLEGDQESEIKGINFCESLYGHRNWVQTSYNNNLRHNFARIGYTWDSENDAFYAPQPYSSWTLDTGSFLWEAPVAYPTGDATGSYTGSYSWNEDQQNWVSGSI